MEEDFKYLGTRGRGGLKENGSEGGPAFQKRKANDQERKFESGSGKKKYPVKKEGTNVLKEIK